MAFYLVAGDTHGNFYHLRDLVEGAVSLRVQTIIVTGDFGYWEHTPEGIVFLDALSELLQENSIELLFLDGNHENHPLLWRLYKEKVRPGIYYQRRGQTRVLNDTPVQFVGGAFSIDIKDRLAQMANGAPDSWWETETLSDDDVNNAIMAATILPPEVMFTHDAPDGCPMDRLGSSSIPFHLQERSRDNRYKLREIVEAAQPDVLVHGHYHRRIDYELTLSTGKVVQCHALGCDVDSMTRAVVRDADGILTGKGRGMLKDSFIALDL